MTTRMKPLLLTLLLVGVTAGAALADEMENEQKEREAARHLPRRFRGLDLHPVGWTVRDRQFRFTNLIRMQPPGFRSDRFNQWFAPTIGLDKGWEATVGVTGAERLGPGGQALFYGAGIQKKIIVEKRGLPDVSIGGFGMVGPHDHHGGRIYLAATQRLAGGPDQYFALDLHGGVKYELFDGDDYGSGSGVRPFIGATTPVGRRLFLQAEFSPKQPWQRSNMYSVGATFRVYRRLGLSGGLRNNGFDTHPFIGISL